MKISDGISATFKAVPFMVSNGLLIWFLPAIFLTLTMSYGVFAMIDFVVEFVSGLYASYFGKVSFDVCDGGRYVSWNCIEVVLKSAGAYVVSAVVWLGLFWLKIKLMKYLVLIFLGPVMAILSERTEEKITGVSRTFSFSHFMWEVFRGVRTALLYLFIELCLLVFLLLVAIVVGFMFPFLLPVIAPLELFIAFVMGAFFYGAASMDYVWERQGAGAVESIGLAVRFRYLAVGLGSVFAILMAIPVVNFTITPIIAPAITAVAASLALKGGL